MSQPRTLAAPHYTRDLPRPDLPHESRWYRARGYPEPLMELHPNALGSYLYVAEQARKYAKMARLVRDHMDVDIRWSYWYWSAAAAGLYADARRTRDFGCYGHTCYDGA